MDKRKTAQQWAWMHADSEEAHGPFTSRKTALADHAKQCDVPDCPHLRIGHPVWPQPEDHVCMNMDLLLDNMEDSVTDAGFYSGDDEHFEAIMGAEDALKKALCTWAKKWVRPTKWTFRKEVKHG